MTQQEIFGNAKWIDCPDGIQAPVFRKEFTAVKGEKAEITICGLGFFELKINGVRVGSDELVPNASNYCERDMTKWSYPIYDSLSFRTYAVKYDITEYLDEENAVSVLLGGGYYHQQNYRGEGDVNYGSPKLCFIIRKDSGDVITDENTDCYKGWYSLCNLYYGERQDYSLKPQGYEYAGYDGGGVFWPARVIETPKTDFFYQFAPADKVTDIITDIKLIRDEGLTKLYDIGRNIAGRLVVECTTPGEKVTVRYAEQIEGVHNWGMHFSDDRYIDEYICDGIETHYSEKLGWQGFRYAEITGDAVPVQAEIIHSDIPVTSHFESSNANLNWLWSTYVYTQLCNMHSGVPSDCPHRERLGYTGDGQLCAEAAMLMLDSREFYRKWMLDIADCQCKNSGHIQHTAPFMGGGGGPCGWGGAIVEVPYRFYKIFGEKQIIEEYFPRMLRYLDYIDSRCEAGLVCREEEGGWCLGDWLPPEPIRVPETYVNTCLYIKFMKMVIELAGVLGKEEEVTHLPARIEQSSKMIHAAYYSFQQRSYCGDVDGASSLALAAGICEENVKGKVIEKYRKLGEFDTGIIATNELIDALFELGENDIAVSLLSGNGNASFANMKRQGATTLWENWNGDDSQNHPMFGAVTRVLFTRILGISQEKDSYGFEKPVIAPCFSSLLDSCKGYITTVKGRISVQYRISDGIAEVDVHLAPDMSARFVYGDTDKTFTGSAHFSVKV